MHYTWNRQPDGSYTVEQNGFVLRVKNEHFPPQFPWEWSVTMPDGQHRHLTAQSLEEAQEQAERAARQCNIKIANKLYADFYKSGVQTPRACDLLSKVLAFLGDSVEWLAFCGDYFMGRGKTQQEAAREAVQTLEQKLRFYIAREH